MDVLWASVFTLRGAKIVHVQGYWTPEQAREAVGLLERCPEFYARTADEPRIQPLAFS